MIDMVPPEARSVEPVELNREWLWLTLFLSLAFCGAIWAPFWLWAWLYG